VPPTGAVMRYLSESRGLHGEPYAHTKQPPRHNMQANRLNAFNQPYSFRPLTPPPFLLLKEPDISAVILSFFVAEQDAMLQCKI